MLNIESPYDPAIPLLGVDPREVGAGTWTCTCLPTFWAVWVTAAEGRTNGNGRTDKVWSICTLGHHLAIKVNAALIHIPQGRKCWHPATSRVDLEDIMLSDISQTQEDKYWMFPLIWNTYKKQIHRDRKQNRSCQGLGRRRVITAEWGQSFCLGWWESAENSGNGYTTMWMHLMPPNCMLRNG